MSSVSAAIDELTENRQTYKALAKLKSRLMDAYFASEDRSEQQRWYRDGAMYVICKLQALRETSL